MTIGRPVVGITSYVEQAQWGVWDKLAVVLPYSYVLCVEAAGARAVVLPPSAPGVDEAVARLDAVVFAGGADLDPALYEAPVRRPRRRHPLNGATHPSEPSEPPSPPSPAPARSRPIKIASFGEKFDWTPTSHRN